MIGGSMSGYSRTGRRRNAMIPKRRIVTLMTLAKTGRRIDTVLSFMRSASRRGGLGLRRGGDRHHLASFEEFLVAGADDRHAGLEALDDFHDVRKADAEGQRHARHGAVGF